MLGSEIRRIVAQFSYIISVTLDLHPVVRARRAISTLITIILVMVIVAGGIAIIYFLVFAPGPTTSVPYP